MIDTTSEIDSKVISLVKSNVSSIDMISEALHVEPEETRTIILRLADDGRLKGHLTLDGSRFFRSDAAPSEAPVLASSGELELGRTDIRPGIIVTLLGFAVYIIGNMLVHASIEHSLAWGIGGAVTVAGPIIVIAGLLIISQLASRDPLGRGSP